MLKLILCTAKNALCIILVFLIALLMFDFLFCPDDLPTLVKWSPGFVPFTFSFNRIEGRKITLAFSWRFSTLSIGHDGIHIFKG